MGAETQQPVNTGLFEALERTISADRLNTYLTAAGHDKNRALELYLWNAQVGEAFHVVIQAVEVGFRNCINNGLIAEFGDEWWRPEKLEPHLDDDRKGDLALALRRITNRGLDLGTGQVVAALSLGFWVSLVQSRYYPIIWSKHLRDSFPDFPTDRSRKSLATAARNLGFLRNRISHHEPLIKRDISKDHSDVMTLLTWICPTKAEWVRPYCRIPELLRKKP